MGLFSTRSTTPPGFHPSDSAPAVTLHNVGQHLSTLYTQVQNSAHLFGSTLGPIIVDDVSYDVPHFVYFGPRSADESPRFAFLSGFEAADLRGTHSLLRFIEHLREFPELGDGLSMSFFPLVDALGAFNHLRDRSLAKLRWHAETAPELGLLEKEVRARRYHGFVRIESAPAGIDQIIVRTRRVGSGALGHASLAIVSPEDTELLDARFEPESFAESYSDGPLSVEGNLPFAPFEITLSLPLSWNHGTHRVAVHTVLRRLIRRYRALQSYGQHL